MRFLIVLMLVLAGVGSARAEIAMSRSQRAELKTYVEQMRYLITASLYRLPPPASGTIKLRLNVQKNGAIRIERLDGGTEALREFVRINLLLTRYPPPPKWAESPLGIGIPINFYKRSGPVMIHRR